MGEWTSRTNFTTAFITYFLASIGEIKTISSIHDGLRIWYSFGYKVLFGAVKYILSRLTSGETDIKEKLKYMIYIIMILYTMSLLTRVLLSKFKIFKEWLSSDFVSTDSDKSLDKSRYIDYFRLAAAIYLGNFLVIGMLYDYKWVFVT